MVKRITGICTICWYRSTEGCKYNDVCDVCLPLTEKRGNNMQLNVKVKKLYENANLPNFKTAGSAGGDLTAYLPDGVPIEIPPNRHALIKTGIAVEVPIGYEMQIRARSGLALKHGIMLVNGVGTIDSDYRGEVGVILYNAGNEPFTVVHGMRIAQAVFAKYETPLFVTVEQLSDTERGEGGFGSTGITDEQLKVRRDWF